MNEVAKKDAINIENMIYEIDGKEVTLDSDLAQLYNVATKRINEAVKNNPDKFPRRFSWILSDEEKSNLWSKFSTANISSMSRTNPRVFTEQGVYMLATILKSKTATEVSIRIMDTFVRMRHYIKYNDQLLPHKYLLLEEKVHPHKFRRTLARKAIDKRMPIDQVQHLLSHTKTDTTLHYAIVNQNNVKISHRRYFCL